MGNDAAEVLKALSCVKVHRVMCTELIKLVGRISHIFPSIESARPRCRSGIEVLCSLNLALEKAKLLIQHCTESSKLYLAITGEATMLRCERVRNALGQSLSDIQNLVPLQLATQISPILGDLKNAKFLMESYEEEAGKVLLKLLRQASDSTEVSEFEAFQIAALRLHITSSKDLLIERRSVKKLLDKVHDIDQKKERILKYLLYLLRKYGPSIRDEQTVSDSVQCEGQHSSSNSGCINNACDQSVETEQHVGYLAREMQFEFSGKLDLLDEFKCPISKRIMHDPVIIASGKTFERMFIEKWFSEGHNTCPMTEQKLLHLSITPNSSMKDLIFKWCRKHGVTIPDPCSQHIPAEVYSWRMTSSSSIASFGSSLNDVPIHNDYSSVSIGFSDSSSVSLFPQIDDDHCSCQSFLSLSGGRRDSDFFHELSVLPWESQCKVMEDVKNHLNEGEQSNHSILSCNFVQSLVRFLKEACDRYDVKAQRVGAQLLLIFVSKSRNEVQSECEDIFHLLVSFLDSEITEEVLGVMEVLSGDQCCISKLVASGTLPSIIKILDSEIRELQVPAIKVLCNLSSNTGAQLLHLGYISTLVSFLKDSSLAGYCLRILKDICSTDEGKIAVAESSKCIASVAEILETGTHEEQEHAVAILLCLCSHCFDYCHLVMKEGVIPSLVTISINGNAGGKQHANQLLRILRDITYTVPPENQLPPPEPDLELQCEPSNFPAKKPSSSKTRFLGRKIRLLAKPRSLALF